MLVGTLAGSAEANPKPLPEAIGSWLLVCPPESVHGVPVCVLHHKDWIFHAGPVTAALEVQSRVGALVPVVTLRGLDSRAAVAVGSILGDVTASLRLDNQPIAEMSCGVEDLTASTLVYLCAPSAASVPAMTSAFPTARSITVRVAVSIPGFTALPRTERSFDLSGTAVALQRLRAAGAPNLAIPAEPGLDWRGLLNKLRKAGGGTVSGATETSRRP